jgi:hypothetical protein
MIIEKQLGEIRAHVARQGWRIIYDSIDRVNAHNLRRAFVGVGIYPISEIDPDDEGLEQKEATERTMLTDILAELDRIDLTAVYRVARLLAIVPRDDDLFKYGADVSAMNLASAGVDPFKIHDPADLTPSVVETCKLLLGPA